MEQLVLLGVILVFSILEAVARGRKGQAPTLPPPEEWGEYVGDDEEGEWSVASYDDEVEDDAGIPGEPLPRYTKPYVPREARPEAGRGSPPVPVEERTGRMSAPRKTAAVHQVHLSHAEFGTDPSSRAGAGLPATVSESRDSKDARAARALLRGAGASSLRQAMILKEVLGPPVALSGEWPGADVD